MFIFLVETMTSTSGHYYAFVIPDQRLHERPCATCGTAPLLMMNFVVGLPGQRTWLGPLCTISQLSFRKPAFFPDYPLLNFPCFYATRGCLRRISDPCTCRVTPGFGFVIGLGAKYLDDPSQLHRQDFTCTLLFNISQRSLVLFLPFIARFLWLGMIPHARLGW